MATIDNRPMQYGLTLKQLREMMELRGHEGVNQISALGGVHEICKKLYTSPTEGKRAGIDYRAVVGDASRPTGRSRRGSMPELGARQQRGNRREKSGKCRQFRSRGPDAPSSQRHEKNY